MKLSNFDYNLPKELIAQQPISPRDYSRLLVLNRKTQKIEHKHFFDIVDFLRKGDVLVLNNTKVFPARLIGRRQETGGKMEVFLLNRVSRIAYRVSELKFKGDCWQVLIGNRRKKVGQIIEFGKVLKCEIIKQIDNSVWLVRFNKSGKVLEKLIDKIGRVPVPPYIKSRLPGPTPLRVAGGAGANRVSQNLKKDYQTVYAQYRGSVAAPTAGFHFTKSLINKLKRKSVKFEFVTLHVGFGTFEPVKVQNIKKHQMHAEFASLDKATAQRLNRAKTEGRRIMAVGTTTVRLLESFVQKRRLKDLRIERLITQSKWINTYIYPGYKFKFVDALITNFHLPKSTLLMLVSALAGRNNILRAYQQAIRKKYRFYSFGDAMLIL